jgi:hypothetical protein
MLGSGAHSCAKLQLFRMINGVLCATSGMMNALLAEFLVVASFSSTGHL